MMSEQQLRKQWLDLSDDWIRESRGRNANRKGLLDQAILQACGDLTGLRILDSGCGEGRFCRLLVELGAAYVLGLDTCETLIQAARDQRMGPEEYRLEDVQEMGSVEDGAFDLAISYLNQCDLPDFEANTRQVFRVLKPGGRFVIANLHPMRSAAGGWFKDATGKKLHAILDNYFDENERRWEIWGKPLTNFHRTLSTYLDGFMKTGFEIVRVIEPRVTLENLAEFPELEDERRVPNFILYILSKPLAR